MSPLDRIAALRSFTRVSPYVIRVTLFSNRGAALETRSYSRVAPLVRCNTFTERSPVDGFVLVAGTRGTLRVSGLGASDSVDSIGHLVSRFVGARWERGRRRGAARWKCGTDRRISRTGRSVRSIGAAAPAPCHRSVCARTAHSPTPIRAGGTNVGDIEDLKLSDTITRRRHHSLQ